MAILFGLIMSLAHAAQAEEVAEDPQAVHPWLTDRFLLHLGEFLPRKSIELSARGDVGDDDFIIDFDETFKGRNKESTPNFNFHWRFGEKWWASAEYYDTSYSAGARLEDDVIWEGVTFPKGSYAEAGVGTDISRLVVGRTIYQRDNAEMGFGLGIHWLEISAFIEGEVLIEDQSSGVRRESVKASAPLPNLSLWYIHSFSPRWAVVGRFDWMSASYQEYSGSINNYNLGINFQAFKHLGIGLSYKRFQVDLDVDDEDWFGSVKLTHKGPFISLTANW
jgi:hypothetical protein